MPVDIPYINIHTHTRNTDSKHIEIVNVMVSHQTPQDGYFSVGLHPWQIAEGHWTEKLQEMEIYRNHQKLVAIGEAGIDRVIDVSIDLQNEVFQHQALLAESWVLPLIIHTVRSANELIEMHRKLKPTMPWIIHGYNGRASIAESYLRQGFYLSFGKSLFRPNEALKSALQICPDDRLFLETDDAQIDIIKVYEAAAAIRGTEPEALKEVIYRNFVRLFGERIA